MLIKQQILNIKTYQFTTPCKSDQVTHPKQQIIPEKWFVLFCMCDYIALTWCKLISFLYLINSTVCNFIYCIRSFDVLQWNDLQHCVQSIIQLARAILVLKLILVLVFILFWGNNFYFYTVLVQPKSIVLVFSRPY